MADAASGSGTAAPLPATPANFRETVARNAAKMRAEASAPAPGNGAPAPAKPRAPAISHGDGGETVHPDLGSDAEESRPRPLLQVLGAEDESEAAPEQEAEIDVEPTDEGDPWEADLHGLKTRDVVEAIKNGEIPAELHEHIQVPVKVNGEERLVPLREAAQGYQRAVDYSRSKWQLQQDRQAHRSEVTELKTMIDGWKKSGGMRAGFKKLGLLEAFHQEAAAYGLEKYKEDQLRATNPQAYEAHQQLMKEREERERLQHELSRKPKQDNQREVDGFWHSVSEMYPAAFKKHAIKDSRFAQQRFGAIFEAIYDEKVDLAEQVDAAAQATAEELGELAVAYQKSQAGQQPAANTGKRPNPSPLPGRPQGAPAAGTPLKPKGGTPADFRALMDKRRREARDREFRR